MNDGVSKGQGNSRYLKSNIPANTTLQQLISMLNNGTFPVDFNGINEAGWLQIGTALNKANLFSDQTAAKYPDGTETVDGALSKIPDMVAKIGDLRTTVRTDLGDDWLLCNGDEVSQNEYPQLYEKLMNVRFSNGWQTTSSVVPGAWKQVGSYWIRYEGSEAGGSKIYYADSPTKQGTAIDDEFYNFNDMAYNGTYYVILYGGYNGYSAEIKYSTSIAGPYTYRSIQSGGSSRVVYCRNIICDDDNNFAFAYEYQSNLRLVRGSDPATMSVVAENIQENSSSSYGDESYYLASGNGYYVLSHGSSRAAVAALYAQITNLTEWKETELKGAFQFMNNRFVSQTCKAYGSIPSSLSGTDDTEDPFSNSKPHTFRSGFLDGYYFNIIESSQTPEYPDKSVIAIRCGKDLPLSSSSDLHAINDGSTLGGIEWFIDSDNLYVWIQSTSVIFSNSSGRYLPSISDLSENGQGTYTYIKAKEWA